VDIVIEKGYVGVGEMDLRGWVKERTPEASMLINSGVRVKKKKFIYNFPGLSREIIHSRIQMIHFNHVTKDF
jgi:hypothetical protein